MYYHKILIATLMLPSISIAQVLTPQTQPKSQPAVQRAAKNWHLGSVDKDHVVGARVSQAYDELLNGKTSKKVIVAVLDAGVDSNHPDLKGHLWVNKKEIAGNGKDDDRNGYVDDIQGWNFLGNGNGASVLKGSLEADREYLRLTKLYTNKDTTKLVGAEKNYLDKVRILSPLAKKESTVKSVAVLAGKVDQVYAEVGQQFKGQFITVGKLWNYIPTPGDKELSLAAALMQMRAQATKLDTSSAFEQLLGIKQTMISGSKQAYEDQLEIAQQNYRDLIFQGTTKNIGNKYGNNQVDLAGSDHGTHVNGIIAARRGGKDSVNGICENIELMNVRVVINGADEYDEDIANGIRYAVDNGASIINMSLGKQLSPNKKLVDDALKYAEKKNVLVVKAAGNEGLDIDTHLFYPSAVMSDGKKLDNVITVGATDPAGRLAKFSNYGKNTVDLFAPGVDIYSTIPVSEGSYAYKNGTSMAAPVVTGVAALIKSYYPGLSAKQIKSILLSTVTKGDASDTTTKKLEDISLSGGIVNAFEALKLAEKTK